MKDIIKLNDLLQLSKEQLKTTKIRFMVPSGAFNPQKDAGDKTKHDKINLTDLVYNSQNIYFKKDITAIGFINIRDDQWLMTGIVTVLKDNGSRKAAKAKYLDKRFNFRIVIKYHKKSQQGIRKAEDIIDDLEVIELWNPDKSLDDKSFPGYKNVTISYSDLKKKIETSDEWRTALSCRKGIYLITDTHTGKLYVGSAYGINGILGRWTTYIKSGYDKNEVENGKYPNKKLQTLVRKEGLSYIKQHFTYSILETFTDDVSDEYIIERESWWKEALQSREFGYNAN